MQAITIGYVLLVHTSMVVKLEFNVFNLVTKGTSVNLLLPSSCFLGNSESLEA